MKYNKYIITAIWLCICVYKVHSQQLVDNDRAHRRYWYYRTRFINDFINIGDKQGDGICFPERNDKFIKI